LTVKLARVNVSSPTGGTCSVLQFKSEEIVMISELGRVSEETKGLRKTAFEAPGVPNQSQI
jgi:hypothetical protein